eukprot:5410622-Amphidinium_carterae.1
MCLSTSGTNGRWNTENKSFPPFPQTPSLHVWVDLTQETHITEVRVSSHNPHYLQKHLDSRLPQEQSKSSTLPLRAKRFKELISREALDGWHPNDGRSQGLPDLHEQVRGNAPTERAPSDAGGGQIHNTHEWFQRNDSRERHPNDELSHNI